MDKAKLKQNEVEFWQVDSWDELPAGSLPLWLEPYAAWEFGESDKDNFVQLGKYHVNLHFPGWAASGMVQVPDGDYLVKGCGGYIIPVAKEDFPKYFEVVQENAT